MPQKMPQKMPQMLAQARRQWPTHLDRRGAMAGCEPPLHCLTAVLGGADPRWLHRRGFPFLARRAKMDAQ